MIYLFYIFYFRTPSLRSSGATAELDDGRHEGISRKFRWKLRSGNVYRVQLQRRQSVDRTVDSYVSRHRILQRVSTGLQEHRVRISGEHKARRVHAYKQHGQLSEPGSLLVRGRLRDDGTRASDVRHRRALERSSASVRADSLRPSAHRRPQLRQARRDRGPGRHRREDV